MAPQAVLCHPQDWAWLGEVPISKEETLEIFTFMRAANMSSAKGGKIVTMEEAWKSGQKEAIKLLKAYK